MERSPADGEVFAEPLPFGLPVGGKYDEYVLATLRCVRHPGVMAEVEWQSSIRGRTLPEGTSGPA